MCGPILICNQSIFGRLSCGWMVIALLRVRALAGCYRMGKEFILSAEHDEKVNKRHDGDEMMKYV